MSDIYVERGVLGKPYEKERDVRIKLEFDQLFLNVNHFREVLKDFAIQEGFELRRVKNEKTRVTCECADLECIWRIHASLTPDGVTFKIKTYEDQHTCIRTTKNSDANSAWIAKKLESILVADPNISYSAMKQVLLDKHGLEPSNLMQLYRAKRKVHETTRGVHALSYNDLPAWALSVRKTNPGSIVKIVVEPRVDLNPQFKRIFICLDAMKKGFVRGCRPWFRIDGCHLKGPYGGILMCAVSLDGNKGMFPIAIAVVEVECKESWRFFLMELHEALLSVPEWKDKCLTIMSDMQKGLTQAVTDIFPYAKHRFCCNHMLNHFKTKFRSLLLTSHFWACAMAYNEFMFEKAISALRKVSNDAADWLLSNDRPKRMWARHTYDLSCKSDHVTNNVCEVFNAWIGDDRKKTVLAMLQSVMNRFMVTFQKRYEKASVANYMVTPRVRVLLDKTMQDSRYCVVSYAGSDEFQVKDGFTQFVVKLNDKFCGCNYWQITGLPCKHVCACVRHKRANIESYCDLAFYNSKWLLAYSEILHPMPELDVKKRGGYPNIDPPALKRLPGRPRKSRRKSEVEGQSGTQQARRSNTVRCSTCKEFGHNYRTCQRAPVGKPRKPRKNRNAGNSESVQANVTCSQQSEVTDQQTQINSQVPVEYSSGGVNISEDAAKPKKRQKLRAKRKTRMQDA